MIAYMVCHQDYAIGRGMSLEVLMERQGMKCFYCEKQMILSLNHPDQVTRDHLLPASHRFTLRGNTVLACTACNVKKGDRAPTVDEVTRAAKLYDGYFFMFNMKNGKPVMRCHDKYAPFIVYKNEKAGFNYENVAFHVSHSENRKSHLSISKKGSVTILISTTLPVDQQQIMIENFKKFALRAFPVKCHMKGTHTIPKDEIWLKNPARGLRERIALTA